MAGGGRGGRLADLVLPGGGVGVRVGVEEDHVGHACTIARTSTADTEGRPVRPCAPHAILRPACHLQEQHQPDCFECCSSSAPLPTGLKAEVGVSVIVGRLVDGGRAVAGRVVVPGVGRTALQQGRRHLTTAAAGRAKESEAVRRTGGHIAGLSYLLCGGVCVPTQGMRNLLSKARNTRSLWAALHSTWRPPATHTMHRRQPRLMNEPPHERETEGWLAV